ncbi:MAG TPA: SGNH/GDSL hydrolase family protein [Gemmatimonadaceae bacterium]|jgi:lysophospholipase L1-like esterase|nr:SGNH/GDSL hydrolase family protein [Gemmatimonadaceae bacterium]
MPRITYSIRGAALLVLMSALAACSSDKIVLTAPPPAAGALFDSYVALGNSITAGYQSGGINDSTQRESYAVLLANEAGARFAIPALTEPGCPPPIANFQTQARFGGGTSTTCALRDPSSITSVINNLAVPGATSADPTASTSPAANTLTQLILGGETQVQRALEANPTFVSVWIGNNDVLTAAVTGLLTPTSGVSPGVTPTATFIARYDSMMTALRTAPRLQGGVLVGVVDVTNVPILFPAAALANPQFKAGFDQFAGQTTTVLANCTNSGSLISFLITAQIRSGAHPAVIGCEKNSVPGTPVGDIFVLDTAEQTALHAAVAAYNAEISKQASDAGFVYVDPNPALLTLKQANQIPAVPNLADPVHPFGTYISLDGIHPAKAAHVLIANLIIDAINAKYGTSIPHAS